MTDQSEDQIFLVKSAKKKVLNFGFLVKDLWCVFLCVTVTGALVIENCQVTLFLLTANLWHSFRVHLEES